MEQFGRILRIRIRIMVVMSILEVVKSINLKPSLWMGRIMLNTIDFSLLTCIGKFNFVFLEQVDFNQVLLYFLNIWKIGEKILCILKIPVSVTKYIREHVMTRKSWLKT